MSRRFPKEVLAAALNEEIGELMEYRHLIGNPKYREFWKNSYGNELGRLTQGVPGRVEGTNTIFFIHKKDVPAHCWKNITHGKIVVSYRPTKDDPNRTCLTMGGGRIIYPGYFGTPTIDLLTFNLHQNSTISTDHARYMKIDINNFYLHTPMEQYEYMRLNLSDLLDDVIKHYNLEIKVTSDGCVYLEFQKGMYGLPQAGILAHQLLEKRLNDEGYTQSKLTPGFWTHKWRPIFFTLCVDDFGITYVCKKHAKHLMGVLSMYYTILHDCTGAKYLGIDLD